MSVQIPKPRKLHDVAILFCLAHTPAMEDEISREELRDILMGMTFNEIIDYVRNLERRIKDEGDALAPDANGRKET